MRLIDHADLDRLCSYLDDPAVTLNLLNNCHEEVGWRVSYANHVLTLRCLECDLPFYHIAAEARGIVPEDTGYSVELTLVNTCHVGRGWDIAYSGGLLTLHCPECDVPAYRIAVGTRSWPC